MLNGAGGVLEQPFLPPDLFAEFINFLVTAAFEMAFSSLHDISATVAVAGEFVSHVTPPAGVVVLAPKDLPCPICNANSEEAKKQIYLLAA